MLHLLSKLCYNYLNTRLKEIHTRFLFSKYNNLTIKNKNKVCFYK